MKTNVFSFSCFGFGMKGEKRERDWTREERKEKDGENQIKRSCR